MSEIYALKTNHIDKPMGFYMKQITLSWKVGECKATRQNKARIMVALDEKLENKVYNQESVDFRGAGSTIELELKPYTRYFWKVLVETDTHEILESEVTYFETAKMDESWFGQWITCDVLNERHPIFEKKITPKNEVAKARLYISGLGLYEASYKVGQNCQKIGNENLAPYCNNYNQWVQYQTYDVTKELQQEGELSILLGNGWYKGRFGGNTTPESKGAFGDTWKLIAEIHLDYIDGTKEIIGTDESWTVTRSNITASSIYDGESLDDTLESEESFSAILVEPPKGRLTERLSLPVIARGPINPVELIRTTKDELVLDLGQEITGTFELYVDIPYGKKLHIQTGEILQDGCFYNDNLRTAKSEFNYVSDGKPKVLAPKFTFYGYRYVKIDGVPTIKLEDFKGIPLISDYEEIGDIQTDNELVNKFISNVRWGMRDNFLDVPTDCPQRDERLGWTGDAQVFSDTALFLGDTYAFYQKYLYDMYQDQLERGGMVPYTVPALEPTNASAAWGDAACILPWTIYQHYGDKTILANQYESMKAWVEYIGKINGENHGWQKNFHFGDWLALDRLGAGDSNVYGATDEAFIADVYYAVSTDILYKTCKLLDRQEDSVKYETIVQKQWDYVKTEYYTPTGRCAINTQTGLLLTLKYHLSSDENRIKRSLRNMFRENQYKLQTGFVGTAILCNVLSENDMTDIAYHLLMNEDYPGWLHEVKLGATTVWERWNSLDENGYISSTGMNSLNHYSYGAVLGWMFRFAAGFRMSENNPEKSHMLIAPEVNLALGMLDASYDSPYGKFRSKWEILSKNTIRMEFEVPFNSEADVVLPYANEAIFENSDNPLLENVKNHVCNVKAGKYQIEYQTSQVLKKTYSVDSKMEDLMMNKEVRAFLKTMVDVDMIPVQVYDFTLAQVAEMFAAKVEDEQAAMVNAVLSQF